MLSGGSPSLKTKWVIAEHWKTSDKRWVRGLTPATLPQAPELETSLRHSVTLPLNKYNRKQEMYGMSSSAGVRSLHKVIGGLGPTVTTGYKPHSDSPHRPSASHRENLQAAVNMHCPARAPLRSPGSLRDIKPTPTHSAATGTRTRLWHQA